MPRSASGHLRRSDPASFRLLARGAAPTDPAHHEHRGAQADAELTFTQDYLSGADQPSLPDDSVAVGWHVDRTDSKRMHHLGPTMQTPTLQHYIYCAFRTTPDAKQRDIALGSTDAELMEKVPETVGTQQACVEADTAPGPLTAVLGRDWTILKGCRLGGVDDRSVRVGYVLVHPRIGIALIDILPAGRTRDLVGHLHRTLDAYSFTATFGGYPPVVHCRLTADGLPGLSKSLERMFRTHPPVALSRGDAWARAVLRILAPPSRPSSQPVAQSAVATDRPEASLLVHSLPVGAQLPVRGARGMRILAGCWIVLVLTFLGGIALLQYLGPPEDMPLIEAYVDTTGAEVGSDLSANSLADSKRAPQESHRRSHEAQDVTSVAGLATSGDEDRSRRSGDLPPWRRVARATALPGVNALDAAVAEGPAPQARRGSEAIPISPPLAPPPSSPEGREDGPVPTTTLPVDASASLDACVPHAVSLGGPSSLACRRAQLSEEATAPAVSTAQSAAPDVTSGLDQLAAPTPPSLAKAQATRPEPHQGAPEYNTAVVAGAPRALFPLNQPMHPPPPSEVVVTDSTALPDASQRDRAAALSGTEAGEHPVSPALGAAATALPPGFISVLLRRGEAMLALGDFSAARLLFGRAAAAGSSRAAATMGKTYDPAFTTTMYAHYGIQPDIAVAAAWYRRAIALGDSEMQERLALLEGRVGE